MFIIKWLIRHVADNLAQEGLRSFFFPLWMNGCCNSKQGNVIPRGKHSFSRSPFLQHRSLEIVFPWMDCLCRRRIRSLEMQKGGEVGEARGRQPIFLTAEPNALLKGQLCILYAFARILHQRVGRGGGEHLLCMSLGMHLHLKVCFICFIPHYSTQVQLFFFKSRVTRRYFSLILIHPPAPC